MSEPWNRNPPTRFVVYYEDSKLFERELDVVGDASCIDPARIEGHVDADTIERARELAEKLHRRRQKAIRIHERVNICDVTPPEDEAWCKLWSWDDEHIEDFEPTKRKRKGELA